MWLSRALWYALCPTLQTKQLFAQVDSILTIPSVGDDAAFALVLDSVVISDFKKGLDIPFFIKKMQSDESFYKAFKLFRYQNCDLAYEVAFSDKHGQTIAKGKGLTRQNYQDECRTMKVMRDSFSGKMLDQRGDYRFYTMKLFDRVFFTKGKVCGAPPEQILLDDDADHHLNELKKLIFKPGTKADVPFIGHKMAIFGKSMAPYYNYRLVSAVIKGVECYSFIVSVKPEVEREHRDATVVKFLETYFDRKNYQVVGRNYHLVYQGFWFDFDVHMDVELTPDRANYLPKTIHYQGYWDVPMKKAERGSFELSFDYR